MITGELRNKVVRVWDASWSGGISDPSEVIEQITYRRFVRCLDELQIIVEEKARITGQIEDPVVYPISSTCAGAGSAGPGRARCTAPSPMRCSHTHGKHGRRRNTSDQGYLSINRY